MTGAVASTVKAADEGSFLELLIASERVDRWLDCIKDQAAEAGRLQQAVEELAQAVNSSEAYAEEARQCGAATHLTSLLKRVGDGNDALLDRISDVLATLSGPMAAGDRLHTLRYAGHDVVIKEGALGDGVGAKVWHAAHALCREMEAHPEMVAGRSVLELGAGCGVCGLLAAKLGADHVVLTDYVDKLLLNLREAMHCNDLTGSHAGRTQATAASAERRLGEGTGPAVGAEEGGGCNTDWDPEEEEGSECSDLDAALAGMVVREGDKAAALAWEAGNAAVRFLDWSDSVAYLDQLREDSIPSASNGYAVAAAGQGTDSAQGQDASGSTHFALDGPSTRSTAPGVPPSQTFQVILGTEVLYEWPMAEWVPAALAHRLQPGGRALIYMAVRDQAMFEGMLRSMKRLGLRVGVRPWQPQRDDGGIMGRGAEEYEGGYVTVAVEHAAAPASDWHRADLFG